jgi:hypothetical protein
MKKFFDNANKWIMENIVTIIFYIAIFLFGYSVLSLIDVTRKPVPLEQGEGIQHHLVWDINGKCFFVKPHSQYTNYLVAVSDCDKK